MRSVVAGRSKENGFFFFFLHAAQLKQKRKKRFLLTLWTRTLVIRELNNRIGALELGGTRVSYLWVWDCEQLTSDLFPNPFRIGPTRRLRHNPYRVRWYLKTPDAPDGLIERRYFTACNDSGGARNDNAVVFIRFFRQYFTIGIAVPRTLVVMIIFVPFLFFNFN